MNFVYGDGYNDGYACEKYALVEYNDNDQLVIPEQYRRCMEYDAYVEGFEDGMMDAKTDREFDRL